MSLEIKVCKNVLLTHLVTIREYIIQNLSLICNIAKKIEKLWRKSLQKKYSTFQN